MIQKKRDVTFSDCHLAGVTMEEAGISQILSAKLAKTAAAPVVPAAAAA